MTTPTTPKAGDITEIRWEILAVIADYYSNLDADYKPEGMCPSIDKIIAQALAKQKESIKEQLRMNPAGIAELVFPSAINDLVARVCYKEGFNAVVNKLNEKLNNL